MSIDEKYLQGKIASLEKQVPSEDEEEEVPEAFTPQFTVAPESIPPESQVHLPSEEEKQATLESVYKKLGLKAKQFIEQPPEPMTPEKEKMVFAGSKLIGAILSISLTWGYSIFGLEYGILAPTVDQSAAMVSPLLRIVARHSKVIGNISPDAEDLGDFAKAVSDYVNHSMFLLEQIREDKRLGRIRDYRTEAYQTGASNTNVRSNGMAQARTNTPLDASNLENNSGNPVSLGNLTEYEQYNHDQLSQLRQRDLNHRIRRAGYV